ncbi:DEAD/DEAH box helicase [Clostridium felsineum]|uniref:DEAD/DEAH box helicase n=1 Tax=Clostridium felsineum TaxID=36839 RepID=UPI00098C2CF7|nr:DEAD/DEAH box helicase [Clostridium felsineum]URZ18786.1 hypothetical protein CLFE_048740 [Clostridium felsineum DSM 794]
MKKFIDTIIKEEYKQWGSGDRILINSGTGTGKSTFIKRKLNNYAYETNKKILYLTNRNTLRNQILNDLQEHNNITVLNYQKIEEFILKNVSLDNFDYIVCDEAHYFFTDAVFNRKTDLFFNMLIENVFSIVIFMTATPLLLINYMKKSYKEFDYTYKLDTDYTYIKKVVAYTNDESVESIIENIPEDEQIMFFSTAKKSLEIAKKYKGTFICSKYNKNYNKYVSNTENEKELDNIIKNGCFNNHLLCTTTFMDCGVNIKESTAVKHIILDILDIDSFIQCLGRKRIADGEKINLYFNSYKNKGRINGFRKKVSNTLEIANYLIENGQEKFVEHKFKSDRFADGRIIDEYIKDGNTIKVVNKCMYQKVLYDYNFYETLLNKTINISFIDIVANRLRINRGDITELEVTEKTLSVGDVLESLVGKKIYKKEKKELINFIGLKDSKGRLQKSIGQINEYLKSNNIPYIILSKVVKNNNKCIRVWIVDKLILQ